MSQPEPQQNEVPRGQVALTTATLIYSHSVRKHSQCYTTSSNTTHYSLPSSLFLLEAPWSLECSPELHLESTSLRSTPAWLHAPSPTLTTLSHGFALLVYFSFSLLNTALNTEGQLCLPYL